MRIQIKAILVLIALILCPALTAGSMEAELNTELVRPDYTLALASNNQGILQDQSLNQTESTDMKNQKQYPKFKSERTATLLAVFPGFLIHGIGHIYAGEPVTGTILFGMGILTLPAVYVLTAGIGVPNDNNGKITILDFTLGMAVIALFVGSWAYDFSHASTAVRKYNDRVRGQIIFHSDEYNDIKVSLSFAF